MTVRAGEFVKEHLDADADAVEHAGVQLSIDTIYRVTAASVLTNDTCLMGDRTEVPQHDRYSFEQRSDYDAVNALREYGLGPNDETKFYHLDEDSTYVVEYAEDIHIPEGHIGLVFPEESLLHAGATLFTGVWDATHEGTYEGTLRVDRDLLVEVDKRVGTLVLFEADAVDDEVIEEAEDDDTAMVVREDSMFDIDDDDSE